MTPIAGVKVERSALQEADEGCFVAARPNLSRSEPSPTSIVKLASCASPMAWLTTAKTDASVKHLGPAKQAHHSGCLTRVDEV